MLELDGKTYYSTSEVAFELRKSQELIRKWCREKLIESVKLGRDYYIDAEELERLKRYFKGNSILRRSWKAWLR